MRSTHACGLLCALFFFPVAHALCQERTPRPSSRLQIIEERNRSLTRSTTLDLYGVWSMLQDREGYLWFGTTTGLYRYDGYELKSFRHSPFESGSLSSNRIRGLYEDHEGMLWIGTLNGGLNRLDTSTGTFVHYRHVPGDLGSLNSDVEIRAIGEDYHGNLWVGTRTGLNRLHRDSGTFTRLHHDDSATVGQIEVFYLDDGGTFWIGSGGGLLRLNPDGRTLTRYLQAAPSHDARTSQAHVVTSMAGDLEAPGFLWLGTNNGLLHFDSATGRYRRVVLDPNDTKIFSIQDLITDPTAPNVLWLATAGAGLVRFDTRHEESTPFRQRPDDPNSPSSNSLLTIFADRFGSLWASSLNAVDQFTRDRNEQVYYRLVPDDPMGHDAPIVSAIYEDRSGALWVGLFAGEISRIGGMTFAGGSINRFYPSTGDIEQWKHVAEDPRSLADGIITSILEDRNGRMWLGIWGGGLNLMERDTGRFTQFIYDPNDTTTLSSNRVLTIFEDSGGILWIGTNKQGDQDAGGLSRLEPETGRFTRFLHREDDPTSLGGVTVLVVAEDRAGRLWIGTDNGLSLLNPDGGKFTTYRHDSDDPQSLLNNFILALYVDPTGHIWIGTPGGLDRFDPDSGIFTHFTGEDGLLGGDVMAIVPDNEGFLWIATRDALSRFDPATATVRHFEGASDLRARQYLLGAHFRSARGQLFFPSTDGILSFSPRDLKTNVVPPVVLLTGIRHAGGKARPGERLTLSQSLKAPAEIRLAHDENSIDIDFVALHFKDPKNNRYAYRLDEFDESWVHAGTKRTATYTNLDPGAYTFRVKAANGDGVWSDTEATVRIIIALPWWRTVWAYLLYGTLISVALYGVDRVQRRRIILRERARSRIEAAEIRAEGLAAEMRHKEVELEKARELERVYTQLKAHEEQLEAQALRLKALDEQKNRFFANISHEFRTPLTLLLGPIEDALRHDSDVDRRKLDAMRRAARRLLRLIDQLLDLARLEHHSVRLHLHRADVVDFIRNLVLAFAAAAERNEIMLSFHSTEERCEGFFDPEKLETIVTNLISNAVKFTPAGGKVGVKLELLRQEERIWAAIVVRDTGRGIPPEELPHIFDRFYQADCGTSRPEGLGLGLALAKELVELHGGSLEAESQVDFGTTFTLQIPLGEADYRSLFAGAPAEGKSSRKGSGRDRVPAAQIAMDEPIAIDAHEGMTDCDSAFVAGSRAGELVLIVEDNPDLRSYLRAHLTVSYEVMEAGDGREGLALVRERPPDLIIADVKMPHLDGLALCRAIKGDPQLDQIPVILLSARAAEEDRLEGLQMGADDYLTKPFSAAELMLRVQHQIRTRSALRDRFSSEVVIRPGRAIVSSESAVFVERVREVIERRMSDSRFGVDELAADLHMSTRQLQRRMKEAASLSASDCMRMMKLDRAAELLEQDAGRVSDIAAAVGYTDVKHFSRRFRDVFGVLPSEFGRRARQKG